ncbi:MAG: amidohydrolase [Planctomycetaceae bacterium]
MRRIVLAVTCIGLISLVPFPAKVRGDESASAAPRLRPSQETAIEHVDAQAETIKGVNKAIWEFAELGLQEHKSSGLLIETLERAGFEVEKGVADMPTAFMASYGGGKPIIGILAEYDALPGMSQKVVSYREPVEEGANGHACGHSGFAAGSLGAALAVKEALAKHGIRGTIRLYGTPAEEQGIGKVYMARAGLFDDLDACLSWHPISRNAANMGSSKAVVSAKFTFHGTPAHASVSPESGRSALDAVELMNIGANYMREHVSEDTRIHHVITDGGRAPNVVPPVATVWYYVRGDRHADVERNFEWLEKIAEGAALMTQTKHEVRIDSDVHEYVPNLPLAERIVANMQALGPPTWTEEEVAFARRLQEPLREQFGTSFPQALATGVTPVEPNPPADKGSTDVGDVSHRVPTGSLGTVCRVYKSPGHSWQNVAVIGSSIGEKGILFASKSLAATALDLFEQPRVLAEVKADWRQRMKGRDYVTLIPEGQKAPRSIR